MSKELLEAAKAVLYSHGVDGLARGIANLRAVVDRLEAEPDVIEHEGRRFVRTGEVRYPKREEWYTDENDIPWKACLDHGSCEDDKPWPILRELPAAPSVDEARVAEAMNAVADVVFQKGYTPTQTTLNTIADALRPYVLPSPAPQPGTVVVKVETLRSWADRLFKDGKSYAESSYKRCFAHLVDVGSEIVALLPPTPPSPSEADRKRWEAEFRDWAYDYPLSDLVNEPYYDKLRDAWMSSAEAEWRGKNGGAK